MADMPAWCQSRLAAGVAWEAAEAAVQEEVAVADSAVVVRAVRLEAPRAAVVRVEVLPVVEVAGEAIAVVAGRQAAVVVEVVLIASSADERQVFGLASIGR